MIAPSRSHCKPTATGHVPTNHNTATATAPTYVKAAAARLRAKAHLSHCTCKKRRSSRRGPAAPQQRLRLPRGVRERGDAVLLLHATPWNLPVKVYPLSSQGHLQGLSLTQCAVHETTDVPHKEREERKDAKAARQESTRRVNARERPNTARAFYNTPRANIKMVRAAFPPRTHGPSLPGNPLSPSRRGVMSFVSVCVLRLCSGLPCGVRLMGVAVCEFRHCCWSVCVPCGCALCRVLCLCVCAFGRTLAAFPGDCPSFRRDCCHGAASCFRHADWASWRRRAGGVQRVPLEGAC